MTMLELACLRASGSNPMRAIEYLITTDSTMHLAAGRALGTVVIADEQTAGQGRHGHSWHSERGSGIYFSIVLRPAPLLTLALGLATAEAITTATGIACDLIQCRQRTLRLGQQLVIQIRLELQQRVVDS